jgi:hypothetical protein
MFVNAKMCVHHILELNRLRESSLISQFEEILNSLRGIDSVDTRRLHIAQ